MFNGQYFSVIMPIYNEERTVGKMIKRVLAQKTVDMLILVYEPSIDNTLTEIKKAIAGHKNTILLINKERMGKGYSVRRGIDYIKRGIIIIQDADEEYFPEDYKILLAKFDDKTPVFGMRKFISGHRYVLGSYANDLHTLIFNLLFNQNVKDINVCYKLFTKDMIKGHTFVENGWKFDMELAILLAKNNYKIKNAPIHYKGRTFDEGKKIGAGAAIEFIFYIVGSWLSSKIRKKY